MGKLTKPRSHQVEHQLNAVGAAITTAREKFDSYISFNADFIGGDITGQPELSDKLQEAVVAAFTNGISAVHIIGDFYINKPINLYPGVNLVGGVFDRTLIRASADFPNNQYMIQSIRPAGWATGCQNLGLQDIYLVGKSTKTHHAIDFGDASYFRLVRVRADLFDRAYCFNRRIDAGRVQNPDGSFTYPLAHTPDAGGQCYFGVVEQCYAGNCTVAVEFCGVFNRATFTSNTWASCDLAYNFSNPRSVVETNTFITCNIEGCKVTHEWYFGINSPFHNVWINTSLDNGNPEFTMRFKDPGRQTFIGLAVFPYNRPDLVSIEFVNPTGLHSTWIGTDNGFALEDERLVNKSREKMHMMAGIANKVWTGQFVTATIPANGFITVNVNIPGLKGNSAVIASLSQLKDGLVIQPASNNDNVVSVGLYNMRGTPMQIDNAYLSVTGIDQSFF